MKFFVLVILCITLVYVKAQVSTKLDLEDESKEEASPRTSSSNSSKISPKIQGVRVTVDTGNGKKTTETESKESVEIIDTKNTKRVGIHTDITFEISDDKNESNATSSEQAEKDNDASVPIFKGRTTTRRPSHRLPFNPKVHSDYPSGGGGNGPPIYTGDHDRHDRDRHHHYNNNHNYHNIPVFPRTNDEGIYRSVDRWTNVIPIASGVWTTERSSYYNSPAINSGVNYRSFQPHYQQQRQSQPELSRPDWKPCVCLYDNVDTNSLQIRSLRSANQQRSVSESGSKEDIKKVNPFSNGKK